VATFPIPALADVLFGTLQQDRLQGLQIFTDESRARREIVRVEVVPQNINFAQRSRISEQTIKDGRAFFFWRKDRQSDHLDLLELQIQGITRSLAKEKQRLGGLGGLRQVLSSEVQDIESIINPATQQPSAEDEPTRKQRQWLKFWRLTREPFVTENGINHHHITLQTPALPVTNGIDFVGHFAAPIQWGEVADNPFLVTWQLNLIVHYTRPSLSSVFLATDTFDFRETTP
jgi:hypothetical protein